MQSDTLDPITPANIEHSIDEVWNGEKLEQRYNFLDYHFEIGGAYLRARAYVDEMHEVTLAGPFEREGSIQRVDAPEAEKAVLLYLRRRFPEVHRF
jgi:hypothetical protein